MDKPGNKLKHEPIKGKRVSLRLLEERDIDQIRFWRNQDDIRIWFKNSRILDAAEHTAWYQKYKNLSTDYLYILESSDFENQAIGQVGIYNIDWQKKRAEYGRILAGNRVAQGKGLFYEASCLLFQFWKRTYGISDYFLEVKADNRRAIRLYNRLGFEVSGAKEGFNSMKLTLTNNDKEASFTSRYSL